MPDTTQPTITEITDEAVEARLKIGLRQYADSQTMEMGGQSIELTELSSIGSGAMDFDLAQPLAQKVELSLKLDGSMKVQGETARMKVDGTMKATPRG